jgi:hypothetical protein
MDFILKWAIHTTGVPLYLLIQNLWFQLSAVYRSPIKNLKIKEINSS